jgi:hypothetical protein
VLASWLAGSRSRHAARLFQTEVESYFITAGLFYPAYMPTYWVGLRSSASTWPRFQWASSNIPPPSPLTYEHWGLSESVREPDNLAGNEYCGAANYTQVYSNAWGWADFNCSVAMPFVCRQDGRGRRRWMPPTHAQMPGAIM